METEILAADNSNLDRYRAALISKASELKIMLRNPGAQPNRTLKQIEYALWRMERGRYGVCLKCDEEIAQKRLGSLPWALFCENCQQNVDLLQQGAETLVRQHDRPAY